MMQRTLTSVLIGVLFLLPALACAGDTTPRPRIKVEVVPSDVRVDKVDLFTVITNENAFDVYVGAIGSSSIFTEGQNIIGDGIVASERKDFFLVPAKGKRIRQLQLQYQLKQGLNHFEVHLAGGIDPKAKLPPNYIPFGTHHFEFTIPSGWSK
jgi:hypothetical protein